MRIVKNTEELRSLVGEELGVSEWIEISQDRINKFAEATGDFQWIHIDVERAKNELPGATTIAHGFLTLSLLPQVIGEIYKLEGVKHSLNYGTDRVRFTAPVPAGSRVRGRYRLKSLDDVKNNALKVVRETKIEIEGFAAELIDRFGKLPSEVSMLINIVKLKKASPGRATSNQINNQSSFFYQILNTLILSLIHISEPTRPERIG